MVFPERFLNQLMLSRICKESEISEGEVYRFDVQDRPLLVTKVEGKIIVSQAICTHEEADLTLGILLGGTLTCPLHQAKFDLGSGRVISGPDGDAPDTISALPVYLSKVENGELLVELE